MQPTMQPTMQAIEDEAAILTMAELFKSLGEEQFQRMVLAYLAMSLKLMGSTDEMAKLLTKKELAKLLGLSNDGITRLLSDYPEISRVKVGTQWRYPKGDVIQWLSQAGSTWTKYANFDELM